MLKGDLWCAYCGTQDFTEYSSPRTSWECTSCHALFEDNPGYGYFTSDPGDNRIASKVDKEGFMRVISEGEEKFSPNTGKVLDPTKLPRTPEGIVRNSGSREELEAYLARTQIQ